jgi:YidC/Oxa1 family membrane protein insertase
MLDNQKSGKDRKNQIIAALLMGGLFVAWIFWQQHSFDKSQEEAAAKQTEKVATQSEPSSTSGEKDTIVTEGKEGEANLSESNVQKPKRPDVKQTGIFAESLRGDYRVITIDTDLFTAKVASNGGSLIEFTLKDYMKWDKVPTQLVKERKGQLYLTFRSDYGQEIDSRDLYFDFYEADSDSYAISGNQELALKAKMQLKNGGYIEKVFTFKGDAYDFDCDIVLDGMQGYVPKSGFDFCWSGGLAHQEYNSVGESQNSNAIVSRYNKIEEMKNPDEEGEGETHQGMINYVAMKIKYFGMAIIPQPEGAFTGVCDVYGKQINLPDDGVNNIYDVSLRVPYQSDRKEIEYKVYLGPLDYDVLKQHGLKDMVNFGFRIVIRQIGEYFIMPLFRLVYSFIGDWGLTLIIFSIIMKIMLTPFTLPQMRTTQKTKLLGPILAEMREKYADDPKAQQREQMKIYSEYGINPVGGCLPMLLQMPILFALFSVFRSAIELRQSEFIWWITDLSRPDVIFDFGFSMFGIGHLSGLALLMGITMFIQQKMTVTDPKQKAMVYMMPIMMTLMFAYLPAGLTLYYFVFNLLSIVQQVYINKFSRKKITLDDLKRAPKKESWMQRKMREAQEMSEAQGRPVPNSVKKYGNLDEKKNVNYRKKKKKK